MTAIYRAVIYRFECSVINFVRNSVRQHPIKRGQHANEVVNKPSVLILQFYRQCTCTFSVHKVFLGLITSCCSGNDSTLLPQKDTWRGGFALTYFHQHSSSRFFSGRNKTQPKRVAESEKKTSCFAKKMLSKYRIFCLKYQLQWQKLWHTMFVNIFQVSVLHQGNRLNREVVKRSVEAFLDDHFSISHKHFFDNVSLLSGEN